MLTIIKLRDKKDKNSGERERGKEGRGNSSAYKFKSNSIYAVKGSESTYKECIAASNYSKIPLLRLGSLL